MLTPVWVIRMPVARLMTAAMIPKAVPMSGITEVGQVRVRVHDEDDDGGGQQDRPEDGVED